ILEARGDRAQIWVETSDKVFAHREQRPATAIAQRRADLAEEGGLGGLIARVDRQNLLELVEEQHIGLGRAVGSGAPPQIGVQVKRRQLGQRDLLVGRQTLLQREQRAEDIAIGDGDAFAQAGWLHADADRRQDMKTLFDQSWQQLRLEQR